MQISQGDLYPVLDIIIEGRRGIKGDSGGTIISRVKNSTVCSEQDRFHITWATGTWLMTNCIDKYFTIFCFLFVNIVLASYLGGNISRPTKNI